MVELYIAEELTDTRPLGGKKVHFGHHWVRCVTYICAQLGSSRRIRIH
jgi:hypothetical protein